MELVETKISRNELHLRRQYQARDTQVIDQQDDEQFVKSGTRQTRRCNVWLNCSIVVKLYCLVSMVSCHKTDGSSQPRTRLQPQILAILEKP